MRLSNKFITGRGFGRMSSSKFVKLSTSPIARRTYSTLRQLPAVNRFHNKYVKPAMPFVKAASATYDFVKHNVARGGDEVHSHGRRVITDLIGTVRNNVFAPEIKGGNGKVTYTSFTEGKTQRVPTTLRGSAQKYIDRQITAGRLGPSVAGSQAVAYFGHLATSRLVGLNSLVGSEDLSNNWKAYIGEYNCTMEISNATTISCTLEIYDVMPKFSYISKTETQYIGQDPINAWNGGYSWETLTGTAGASTNPDAKPWDSDAFNQLFTIRNVQRIQLQAGSSHRHSFTCHVNKFFNSIIVSTLTPGSFMANGYLRDFTRHTMFVLRGTPVHDATTIANVSTSPIACDIIYTNTVTFYKTATTATNVSVTSSLGAITTAQQVVTNNPLKTTVDVE